MSSFIIKATHKKSKEVHSIWCLDDYFGSHKYGYVPNIESGEVMTEQEFYNQYDVCDGVGRVKPLPDMETYEFDRSEYIKVDFPVKRNRETGVLERITPESKDVGELVEEKLFNIKGHLETIHGWGNDRVDLKDKEEAADFAKEAWDWCCEIEKAIPSAPKKECNEEVVERVGLAIASLAFLQDGWGEGVSQKEWDRWKKEAPNCIARRHNIELAKAAIAAIQKAEGEK
jgi:hypothetical protein